MTNITHIQWHIGDFLSGVMQMDGTEIGAYTMLIMAHYQEGLDGLPSDDATLMKITRTNPKVWHRIKTNVLKKFNLVDGRYIHSRVIEELEKIHGKAGPGRGHKTLKSEDGNPKVHFAKTTSESQVENKSLNLQDSEKTNLKPITNNQEVREIEKNTKKENGPEPPEKLVTDFDRFMAAYPKPISIGTARQSWANEINLRGADPEQMIRAARNYADKVRKEDPKYIPGPAKWLDAQRYLDPDLQAMLPPDPAEVIATLEPWQQRIAQAITVPAFVAWLNGAELSGNVLLVDTRFKAQQIQTKYGDQLKTIGINDIRVKEHGKTATH